MAVDSIDLGLFKAKKPKTLVLSGPDFTTDPDFTSHLAKIEPLIDFLNAGGPAVKLIFKLVGTSVTPFPPKGSASEEQMIREWLTEKSREIHSQVEKLFRNLFAIDCAILIEIFSQKRLYCLAKMLDDSTINFQEHWEIMDESCFIVKLTVCKTDR